MSSSSAVAVPRGGYQTFSGKVNKYYRKMFRSVIYRIILTLLGIPTMIVVLIQHFLTKKDSQYYSSRQQMARQLEEAGVKDSLYQSVLSSTQKKYAFLGKKVSQETMTREVERTVKKHFSELVENELAKTQEGRMLTKPDLPASFARLMESKVFFIFSLITSPLMYVLMLIYSNPYAKYIVDRHNGWIEVESRVNAGTHMTLCLPALAKETDGTENAQL